MADEYDYAGGWKGVFVPTEVNDEFGVSILDDPAARRDKRGRRDWLGDAGADRVDRFLGGPGRALDDEYVRGSRQLGHPGFRGQVTSSRRGRAAIDASGWDNRPPHYAPSSGNDYAHLSVDDRGPPLSTREPIPRVRSVDNFAAAPESGDTFIMWATVALFCALVLLAVAVATRTFTARCDEIRELKSLVVALMVGRRGAEQP